MNDFSVSVAKIAQILDLKNFTDNIEIIPFIYRNITDSIVNHGKTKNQCHISLFYERIIQE